MKFMEYTNYSMFVLLHFSGYQICTAASLFLFCTLSTKMNMLKKRNAILNYLCMLLVACPTFTLCDK